MSSSLTNQQSEERKDDTSAPNDLNDLLYENPIIFKRANEIFKNPKLFKGEGTGIEATDVEQGSLGNCWFLASICALADYDSNSDTQNYLDRIFITRKTSDNGNYKLRIPFDGRNVELDVDDRLPCVAVNGKYQLVYTRSSNNEEELWVPLLEKAFAQYYGNYDRLEVGTAYNALNSLTGNPCEVVEVNSLNKNIVWKRLSECDKSNVLVFSNVNNNNETTTSNNLINEHSYSVLDVFDLNEIKTGLKLIRLRNPWANAIGEFNGKWNDNSNLWKNYKNVAEKVNFSNENDGIFFMTFEECFENFEELTICYQRKNIKNKNKYLNWKTLQQEFDITVNDNTNKSYLSSAKYKLKINKGQSCEWIGLHQDDKRKKGINFYASVNLYIYQNNKLKNIVNLESHDNQTFKKVDLEEGEYDIIPISLSFDNQKIINKHIRMAFYYYDKNGKVTNGGLSLSQNGNTNMSGDDLRSLLTSSNIFNLDFIRNGHNNGINYAYMGDFLVFEGKNKNDTLTCNRQYNSFSRLSQLSNKNTMICLRRHFVNSNEEENCFNIQLNNDKDLLFEMPATQQIIMTSFGFNFQFGNVGVGVGVGTGVSVGVTTANTSTTVGVGGGNVNVGVKTKNTNTTVGVQDGNVNVGVNVGQTTSN